MLPNKTITGSLKFWLILMCLGLGFIFANPVIASLPAYPPQVDDIPDQTISEGGVFALIHLDDFVSDADHNDSDMVWTFLFNNALMVSIENRVAIITAPDSDWNGSETIQFIATDPDLQTDYDYATFTVNPLNDPPTMIHPIPDVAVLEDSPDTIIDLSHTFSDVDTSTNDDNLTLSVSANSDPSLVTAAIVDETLTLAYQLDCFGEAHITIRATDNPGAWVEDSFTVTVSAVNDAPLAVPDTLETDEDTPLSIHVLINDTDPDPGDAIFISHITPALHGSVELNTQQTLVTYRPNEHYTGTDTFDYTISDGTLTGNTVAVTITIDPVNDAPVLATPIADVAVLEDSPDTIMDLSHTFADVDIATSGDNLTLSVSANSDPSLVTAAIVDETLTLAYQLDRFGEAHITIRATDNPGAWVEDSFTVTVSAVNDAPLAIPDTVETSEDTPLVVHVLANDVDVDPGNQLSIPLDTITQGEHGTVELNTEGTHLTYTPDANYFGNDTFNYACFDGTLESDPVSVTILIHGVNDPPLAEDDGPYPLDEDTILAVEAADGLLINDSDPVEVADVLTAVLISPPDHGTLSLISDGGFTYTPVLNFFGTDTFSYAAHDGSDPSETRTVTLIIEPVNDAPVITGQTLLSTREMTPLPVSLSHLTVYDPDNDYPTDFSLIVEESQGYAVQGSAITPLEGVHENLTVPVFVNDGDLDSTSPYPLLVTILDAGAPCSAASSPVAVQGAESWTVSYTAYDRYADETCGNSNSGSGLKSVDLFAKAPGSDIFEKVSTDSGSSIDGQFTFTPTREGIYHFRTIATDAEDNMEEKPDDMFESETLYAEKFSGYAIVATSQVPDALAASHVLTSHNVYQHLVQRNFGLLEDLSDPLDHIKYYLPVGDDQAGEDDFTQGDALTYKDALADAVTNWSFDKMSFLPGPLYLILTGEGNFDTPDTLRLPGSETLTAMELSDWITTLELKMAAQDIDQPIVIVLGFSYSGGFLNRLSKDGRIIVTSSDSYGKSYMGPSPPAGVRESDFFISALFNQWSRNQDLRSAFEIATHQTEEYTDSGNLFAVYPYFDTAVQHPLLNDNGDTIFTNELNPAGHLDNGMFEIARDHASGQTPSAITVTDLNHDGDMDIVVANTGSNDVSILLNNGLGDFSDTAFHNVGTAPTDLVAADFNADNHTDLVTLGLEGVSILMGNGDGTFTEMMTYTTGQTPTALSKGDVNGDGIIDLVVSYTSPTDGTDTDSDGFPDDTDAFPDDPSEWLDSDEDGVGDNIEIDDDGDLMPDAFEACYPGLNPRVDDGNDDLDGDTVSNAVEFAASTNPILAGPDDATIDTDGDMCPDHVDSFPEDATVWLREDDDGIPTLWEEQYHLDPFWDDADQDPDDDGVDNYHEWLANTHPRRAPNIGILLGIGDGSFHEMVSLNAGVNPVDIITGDFNGDGLPDLATANNGSQDISILSGLGDGTFSTPVQIHMGGSPSSLATHDLDNDTHPDLVVLDENADQMILLMGKADGTFDRTVSMDTVNRPTAVIIEDFNNDDLLDIALANGESPVVSIYAGNGDGSLRDPVNYGTRSEPWALAAGDFNGDRRPDLSIANRGSDNITLWLSSTVKDVEERLPDGTAAKDLFLGHDTQGYTPIRFVETLAPDGTLLTVNPDVSQTRLTARFQDTTDLGTVWVEIRPPHMSLEERPDLPGVIIPQVNLIQNGSLFEGVLTGLTNSGRYRLFFFAQHKSGLIIPLTLADAYSRSASEYTNGDKISPFVKYLYKEKALPNQPPEFHSFINVSDDENVKTANGFMLAWSSANDPDGFRVTYTIEIKDDNQALFRQDGITDTHYFFPATLFSGLSGRDIQVAVYAVDDYGARSAFNTKMSANARIGTGTAIDGLIRGYVYNEYNNQPVETGEISIADRKQILYPGGYFLLPLPVGSYTVQVDADGYELDLNFGIKIFEGGITTYNIDLIPIDRDGDTYPDALDAFPDDEKEWFDTDKDGIGNNADSDDDNDDMPDEWEIKYAPPLDPLKPDADENPDNDKFPNIDEFWLGMDPTVPFADENTDTDGDGYPDVIDACPNDPNGYLDTDDDTICNDSDLDDDGDGMPDEWENQYHPHLNPLQNDALEDPDFDKIPNYEEYRLGTDPTQPPGIDDNDSDGDGIPDDLDAFPDDPDEWLDSDGDLMGNNQDPDDDNDGMPDVWENAYYPQLNPLLDDALKDPDNDQVANIDEFLNGTDPTRSPSDNTLDRDGDGIPDDRDRFPDDPTEWLDHDNDGMGNNADPDDDNDGMPDWWEQDNGLQQFINDAFTDPDKDGIFTIDEYRNGTNPKNAVPNTPIPVSPKYGDMGTPLSPDLTTQPFYDINNHGHASSRWQISMDPDFFELVFDVKSDSHLTSIPVPKLLLNYGETYFWRVQFFDDDENDYDEASEWSESWYFTTITDSQDDDNGNGTPDDQEIDDTDFLDMDGNGVSDLDQDDMGCINNGPDSQALCIKVPDEVISIDTMAWIDPDTIASTDNRPIALPLGLISFKLTVVPGSHVDVTLFLSEPAGIDLTWYKYDHMDGWQDYTDHSYFSADRASVVLGLKDGGFGDGDGAENGIIFDPSGPGSNPRTVYDDYDGIQGNSPYGCFIETSRSP
jgi:Bacterial Ig domain/FG-GAP-like repeat